MYKAKNIKLEGVTDDTGWRVTYNSGMIIEWKRSMRTKRTPESIIKELTDAGDYDGWTGVQFAKGYSAGEWLVFTSVWDSTG